MPYRFTKYSPNYNKLIQKPEPLEKVSLLKIKSGDQITLTLEDSDQSHTELELIIKNISQPAIPATALATSKKHNWNNHLVIIHGSWASLDGNEFYPHELIKNYHPEIEWIDRDLFASQEKSWKKHGVIRIGDLKWTKKKLKNLYPKTADQEAVISNLIGKRRELFPKITKVVKVGV